MAQERVYKEVVALIKSHNVLIFMLHYALYDTTIQKKKSLEMHGYMEALLPQTRSCSEMWVSLWWISCWDACHVLIIL